MANGCAETDHDKIIRLESQVDIKLTSLCKSMDVVTRYIVEQPKVCNAKIETKVDKKLFWIVVAGLTSVFGFVLGIVVKYNVA